MFYSDMDMLEVCSEDPTLTFTLIKQGNFEDVQTLIDKKLIDVNTTNTVGNDIPTQLLKAKQYDMVLALIKKRNWDVNHQNVEGNTFGHILALDNSIGAMKIVDALVSKKNFMPNIQNNKGETMLDYAVNNNYIRTALKLLEDKRFNNISVLSFEKLFNACIKNSYYGKYSKLNNLEIIITNLDKKELVPGMRQLLDEINKNIELIKNDIMNDNSVLLERLIKEYVNEAFA